jgi:hypothetical protein
MKNQSLGVCTATMAIVPRLHGDHVAIARCLDCDCLRSMRFQDVFRALFKLHSHGTLKALSPHDDRKYTANSFINRSIIYCQIFD